MSLENVYNKVSPEGHRDRPLINLSTIIDLQTQEGFQYTTLDSGSPYHNPLPRNHSTKPVLLVQEYSP